MLMNKHIAINCQKKKNCQNKNKNCPNTMPSQTGPAIAMVRDSKFRSTKSNLQSANCNVLVQPVPCQMDMSIATHLLTSCHIKSQN